MSTERNVRGESAHAAPEALADPREFYDQRFGEGYMTDFSTFFEETRLHSVTAVLAQLRAGGLSPATILDYGCGEGRYIEVLARLFPEAAVAGSDISEVALEIARAKHPQAEYTRMADERLELPSETFDLVTSFEVLEHVKDVELATRELGRLLKPGGTLVLTTPCANPWSLEWLVNRLTGGLQTSFDGFGRFASDEPGHLRRLTDADLKSLLERADVHTDRILHGAHLFTTISEFLAVSQRVPAVVRHRFNTRVRTWFEKLDWRLFRRLPNGASMVLAGTKRDASSR